MMNKALCAFAKCGKNGKQTERSFLFRATYQLAKTKNYYFSFEQNKEVKENNATFATNRRKKNHHINRE